ncbi:MAG TPA: SGNH/GDSL hydrolase family protein [Vicinamibacterales bacterium]|nr:SGNH/GDSL hydrolase family protein [Vicinamibacterales bacterium]
MSRLSAVLLVLALSTVAILGQNAPSGEHWVGAWSTALVVAPPVVAPPAAGRGAPPAVSTQPPSPGPAAAPAPPPPPGPPPVRNFSNQTLRLIVHPTLGGDRIRVVLSNAFGTAPLVVGGAHVALRTKEAGIDASTGRALKFNGSASTTIPAGAIILSDPVNLQLPAATDLVVDLYVPGDTAASGSPVTMHTGANQTSYVSSTGNYVGTDNFPVATTTPSWFLLARVEVVAPPTTGVIVALGDSITDGSRSTPNTNNRWPDVLARRLSQATGAKMAVLNAGIGGNRVLADGAGQSLLARFDRDVLVQPGVTHVIVLEGINDIGQARANPIPSAADLIAAHRQIIQRAHARGLKIFGATLTPFEGAAYWTPEGEAKRAALNEWIRTGKEYDAVIDFDAATRDPNQPTKFLTPYNSGDNLHPSDAGYQAMANAIDLSLFGVKATLARR